MLIALQCQRCRKGFLCPEDLVERKRCSCGGSLAKSPGKAASALTCPDCGAAVDAFSAVCCTNCGAVFDPRKMMHAGELASLMKNLGLKRLLTFGPLAKAVNGLSSILAGLAKARDFFLPECSSYRRFPLWIALLGLSCVALAYFMGCRGLGREICTPWALALPALALPAVILGALWRRSWLACLGLALALLSFPEGLWFRSYYRNLDEQMFKQQQSEELERVKQAGLRLEEQERKAQEAAAKKAHEEELRQAAEKKARDELALRRSQELTARVAAEKAKQQAQEEQAKLEDQKKLAAEEKQRQAEADRDALRMKLSLDLEKANAALRDKLVVEEHENHLLTLLQKQIANAQEFMGNIKSRIDTLEGKNPNDPQLEEARKSYQGWQVDIEKSQKDLPGKQKSVQKAKDERQAAEKLCADLHRQLKQLDDEEQK
jgi:hypothetical protein